MSTSGADGGPANFETGLSMISQSTRLLSPQTAPSHLLEAVVLDPDGDSLFADTDIGRVAVSLLFDRIEGQEADSEQARFYSALDVELDPDAADNPSLMSRFPYTEVPYGSHVGIVISLPADKAGVSFSEPEAFGGDSMPGYELRDKFPDEDIDVTAKYKVSALRSVRNVVGLLVRNNGNEPAFRRRQLITPSAMPVGSPGSKPVPPHLLPKARYVEYMSSAGMRVSDSNPDVAYTMLAHRVTQNEGSKDVDIQALKFLRHNEQQGPAGDNGLTEIVVFTGRQTRFTNIDLERIPEPVRPAPPVYRGYDEGGMFASRSLSFGGGFESGAVGYGRPRRIQRAEAVRVDKGSVQPVAAFRFVMVGAGVARPVD